MSQVENFGTARRVSGMRVVAFMLKPLALLGILLLLPAALQGGSAWQLPAWMQPADRAPQRDGSSLAQAAQLLKAGPASSAPVLAAEATQEGHWRFVNRAGEMLTAGTAEEMQRVVSILLPDARPADRLALIVTRDTLLLRRGAFKDLPKGLQVRVAIGEAAMPVLGRTDVADEKLYIELRPNVVVEAGEPAAVSETLWHLLRPLDRGRLRLLALETGGPVTLAATPRRDPATDRVLIDAIDPGSLVAAMGSVRGQTLIISGRVERDILYVKPSSGAERGVLTKDLFAAADAADVNLLILESASTPRQPGGRNWLWQKVEVKGLDVGLGRPRLVDLLDAVGGASGRFLASAREAGASRTLLQLHPARDVPPGGPGRGLGAMLLDAVSDLTGSVLTNRVQASLRNVERQREIDRRILPGVPSSVQIGYALLFLLGVVGWRTSRGWWARVWPPEQPGEYANASGYHAARAIREALFWLVFLPVTALPAAPVALAQGIGGGRRAKHSA